MKQKNLLQEKQWLLLMLIVFLTLSIAFSAIPLSDNQLKKITGSCVCFHYDVQPCLGTKQECVLGLDCVYCQAAGTRHGCKGQDLPPPVYKCVPKSYLFCGNKYIGTCKQEPDGKYCEDGHLSGSCPTIYSDCENQ